MTYYITQTIEPWMPLGALKAKDDYAKIAQAAGWIILPIERFNDQSTSDTLYQEKMAAWLASVQIGDLVFHQFPTYMSANFEQHWLAAIKEHGARPALLIHDLEPLRLKKNNPWEFDLLKGYDQIVVHTPAMAQVLRQRGLTQPLIIQELFDYLGPSQQLSDYNQTINFAGTFQKSPWLKKYQGPQIKLFGSRPKKWRDVVLPTAIDYQGNYDPDKLVAQFHSGFGLLWDNNFDDHYYQEYTRINAPHKASLYIKAGLPLIAWSQSAIGQLIQAYDIGFTIEALSQLAKIKEITPDQYRRWQNNLLPLRNKINTGAFTQSVLQALKK